MKSKLQTGLARLRSKFMDALPIILFFLYLFYSVILIFGISHVILVSVVTILFKMNYQRYMTARQLMGLAKDAALMALPAVSCNPEPAALHHIEPDRAVPACVPPVVAV